ncbi:MAG: multiheme c-type cytochrome [Nitrospirota bacterium]
MSARASKRRRRWWAVLAGLILLLAAWWYVEHATSILIFGLRADYRQAVPHQAVPAGLTSLRAESCGECHREIYEEWKSSMHAQAFVDPFFQAYWRKDKHIWVCLNCHSPLENQQPLLIKGLRNNDVERPITEPNPHYDPEYQREGISCAGCHVRDGVILGPYEDSVAPHPTRYDPRFRKTDICYTCHQVASGPLQFYNGGPCATFFEFEEGPYAKRGYICQNCHMPEVERPVAVGGPVRQGRRHLWRGGHDPEMIKRALQAELIPPAAPVPPGETATFRLRVTNGGAGHAIPTGDPDRFFRIELELRGADGRVIKRTARTISRWIIWRPVIIEVYENRIRPLESREYALAARMPEPANADGMTIHAKVSYHILTERAYKRLQTKYGLTEEVPHVFTIYDAALPLDEHRPQAATASASTAQAAAQSPCQSDGMAHGGLS